MTSGSEPTDERFERQLLVQGLGNEGQQRLRQARVTVVGAGGLGCPALIYLARAGVGQLTVIDGDRITLSNLPRQILYTPDDVGKPKAATAAGYLQRANPDLRARAMDVFLDPGNADELLAETDIAIDAADGVAVRFHIAEACARRGLPYVHAGVAGCRGQLLAVRPGHTACLRCLFPETPPEDVPRSATHGVLGPAAGVLGTLEACVAIQHLLGWDDPLENTLFTMDTRSMLMRRVPLTRRPDCTLCGSAART